MAKIPIGDVIPLNEGEMAALLTHNAGSGHTLKFTIPGGSLFWKEAPQATLRKLAEIRGIELQG